MGDGDPLLHPPGELVRQGVSEVREPDQFDQGIEVLPILLQGDFFDLKGKGDVLEDGLPGKEQYRAVPSPSPPRR